MELANGRDKPALADTLSVLGKCKIKYHDSTDAHFPPQVWSLAWDTDTLTNSSILTIEQVLQQGTQNQAQGFARLSYKMIPHWVIPLTKEKDPVRA